MGRIINIIGTVRKVCYDSTGNMEAVLIAERVGKMEDPSLYPPTIKAHPSLFAEPPFNGDAAYITCNEDALKLRGNYRMLRNAKISLDAPTSGKPAAPSSPLVPEPAAATEQLAPQDAVAVAVAQESHEAASTDLMHQDPPF